MAVRFPMQFLSFVTCVELGIGKKNDIRVSDEIVLCESLILRVWPRASTKVHLQITPSHQGGHSTALAMVPFNKMPGVSESLDICRR
jgi:hypothetical protein